MLAKKKDSHVTTLKTIVVVVITFVDGTNLLKT